MEVRVERVMNASAEKLYTLWTDPALIGDWFGARVEIDPRPEGVIKFTFGEKHPHGIFKTLEPHKRIVFTWNAVNDDAPTGETQVTVTFEEIANGQTKMTLVHSGLPTEFARTEHAKGWNFFFDKWEKSLVA